MVTDIIYETKNQWEYEQLSEAAWTTRVSNPVCSPRFRASPSVAVQSSAFATGVLPYIYAFHRYTRNSDMLVLAGFDSVEDLYVFFDIVLSIEGRLLIVVPRQEKRCV